MPAPAPIARPRRKRRSTEEIVNRILAAASEEFEKSGYAGATTARIARKAGVAEALLFGNFGSKANLFHASIFEPLSKHLVDFCATHPIDAGDSRQSREALRRQYIIELQQFMALHHRKLVSLMFVELYGDGGDGLASIGGIQDYFRQAAEIGQHPADRPFRIDPGILARLSFAAIFSGTVFKDWLFPDGMFAAGEIDASLTAFIIDGLNANAGA